MDGYVLVPIAAILTLVNGRLDAGVDHGWLHRLYWVRRSIIWRYGYLRG